MATNFQQNMLVIIASLIISTLAACGQKTSTAPETTTAKPADTAPIPPSFDCGQIGESGIEKMICADNELATFDNRLASIYKAANEKAQEMKPNPLPAEQRGWIKGRNECWKTDDKKQCVIDEYQRRIYELQATYKLVPSKGPFRFVCGESSADEIIITFYETQTPTLIAERDDVVSLMYLQPSASGKKYQGRNESFWEHKGKAKVTWGYNASEVVCKKADS